MRKALSAALWTILLIALTWTPASPQPQPLAQRQISARNGFLYQPSVGDFWDPTVIYANGQYYMYTMYGGDGVWQATSKDGARWKDHGAVLKSEGFKNNRVVKQFLHKVGDRRHRDESASSIRRAKPSFLSSGFTA